MTARATISRIMAWSEREPILSIRRILWLLTGGWWLFCLYLFTALTFLISIIFIPFVPHTFKLALFALDGGITMMVYDSPYAWDQSKRLTTAANVVWLVLFGWGLALAHLGAALIQALTIIGIGTAITQVKIAVFVLWPFGKEIREKEMLAESALPY